MLNYNEMVILDAEDLAEEGLGSSYQKEIVPILRRFGIVPIPIAEKCDPDIGDYRISALGKTYVIYSPDMDSSQGQSWGNATFALFDIVNLQLADTPFRFYAINGGNELGGMLLTPEERQEATKELKRKTDWPYLPEPEPPWYGQRHDA